MDDARRLILRHSPQLLRYFQELKTQIAFPANDILNCSPVQLYVAGHDVAALAAELAKINVLEGHPVHVAWRSLDDAIANDILEEGSDAGPIKAGA